MKKVVAYSDGSCNYKSQFGGYGVYITIEENDQIIAEKFLQKGYSNTTTGRMELRAAIECLKAIQDKDLPVELYCDSMYVVNCVKERRLWRWEKSCWMGLANIELLIILFDEVCKFRTIPKFIHIKGHTKNEDRHSYGNAIADRLADYKQFKNQERDKV